MGFAPNSTTRWFLDYQVGTHLHTMQLRSTSSATAEQASAAFHGIFAALDGENELFSITINQLSRAAAGSNVREPATYTEDTTMGSDAIGDIDVPRFVAFSGRATGNQQVRVFFYGWKGTFPGDYRLNEGDFPGIDAAIVHLASLSNLALSAGLNAPTWKNYANIGFNAYWQRQRRVGG